MGMDNPVWLDNNEFTSPEMGLTFVLPVVVLYSISHFSLLDMGIQTI